MSCLFCCCSTPARITPAPAPAAPMEFAGGIMEAHPAPAAPAERVPEIAQAIAASSASASSSPALQNRYAIKNPRSSPTELVEEIQECDREISLNNAIEAAKHKNAQFAQQNQNSAAAAPAASVTEIRIIRVQPAKAPSPPAGTPMSTSMASPAVVSED